MFPSSVCTLLTSFSHLLMFWKLVSVKENTFFFLVLPTHPSTCFCAVKSLKLVLPLVFWLQVRFGPPVSLSSSLFISHVFRHGWRRQFGEMKRGHSLFTRGCWTRANVLHPLFVSETWTVSRPCSCRRQPLDRQVQRWGISVACRPAANQSWRVAGAEGNTGVEGVSALLVWVFEGKQARWDGMQQIKLKAAEMRVHATWYTPEPPYPPTFIRIAPPWHVPPNSSGTWITEKPVKREIGTVLKWSWQHIVKFFLVTLCFSYWMWTIMWNLSYPHELTSEDV